MKCLLCKGRKFFYVWKEETFDIFVEGEIVRVKETCPRCKGRGSEAYIPYKKLRMKEAVTSYSDNYQKYFIAHRPSHHDEILRIL